MMYKYMNKVKKSLRNVFPLYQTYFYHVGMIRKQH